MQLVHAFLFSRFTHALGATYISLFSACSASNMVVLTLHLHHIFKAHYFCVALVYSLHPTKMFYHAGGKGDRKNHYYKFPFICHKRYRFENLRQLLRSCRPVIAPTWDSRPVPSDLQPHTIRALAPLLPNIRHTVVPRSPGSHARS